MALAPPPSAQDFAEAVLPLPRWIVPKLLPGEGWTLLVAKPKTGKSLLAMQLAAALASGSTFVGREVSTPGRVLYVQLDAPAGDWQEQVRRLPPGARAWDTYTRQELPLYVLDAANSAVQVQLRDRIKAASYTLVIWDALEKLTRQDINTKEGCQLVLDRLRFVSPGANLVVHHPRKQNGDYQDALVDSAAGNHYLTGDASAVWGLSKTGNRGVLKAITRASDETVDLERDPQSFLWLPAKDRPKPPATDLRWG